MKTTSIIQNNNFINGSFCSSKDKHKVYNKYTQELISEIPIADKDDIENAIKSNLNAYKKMRTYSAGKRAEFLENLYLLLKNKENEFAELIALEGGKPISYAKSEVSRALDNLKIGIRETFSFDGQKIPMDYLNGQGKTAYTVRQASGPVLAITPFNFPLNLAMHKLIPAIAVGTSITIKPAPQAPLTMLAFAKLVNKIGLPNGAVNILFTDNKNSQKMVEDDRYKILSFTGSDKVGWMLKSIAGKKKVLLELGGNAGVIVDKNANLKRAARKLAYGSFLNAGQICISIQRIFVHKTVFDKFLSYFLDETKKIKSGYMLDKDVINSSMISRKDIKRINLWIKEAQQAGAEILIGGKILNSETNIYAPTVITHTSNSMKIYKEEAFAPIVIVEKVRDFNEAIKKINDSVYGLQAGVFTNDLENVLKAQRELEVGGVIINESAGFRIDSMPYGGIKNSGIGREGAKYVMEEFSEQKLIVIS